MKTILALFLSLTAFATSFEDRLSKIYLDLATTLSDARNHPQSRVCEFDAYQSEIVTNVGMALSYSRQGSGHFTIPKSVEKAVGDSLTYKHAIGKFRGYQPSLPNLEESIKGITMHGPHRGVYGNESILTFKDGGVLQFDELEVLSTDPWTRWNSSTGTYSVAIGGPRNNQFHITITINGVSKVYLLKHTSALGHINPEWTLVPLAKPMANPWQEGFSDFPSECEA